MTTPLQPVITTAGLAAIWRADNTGVAAEITHIGLGTSAYTPVKSQTALKARKGLYPISDGERLSETLLHLTAVADDALEYWVREVGFYLSDGTLLAVWSDPTAALAYKSTAAQLLLAYDLSLSALPADSVTINSTGAGLNLTLAAPLASLANAVIAEQLRGLKRDDKQLETARLLDIAGRRIDELLGRVSELERLESERYDGLLSSAIANANGLMALQTLVLKHIYG